jgi:hypothetical protein
VTDPVAAYAEACRAYADATRDELVRLSLNAESESVRLGAIKELNDRSFSKAQQEVAVAVGAAVLADDVEVARRLAFILARAAAAQDDAPPAVEHRPEPGGES